MRVLVKKLDPKAAVPSQAREGDFCYDVVATSRRHIGWRKWEYGIGLAFEIKRGDIVLGEWFEKTEVDGKNEYLKHSIIIPETYFNKVKLDLDFRPRSSVYKTGLSLSNCSGTLDELYRGEVKAIFYNITFGKRYKVGERIGQIKLGISLPLSFEIVDELSKTERGTGGFGSTGR